MLRTAIAVTVALVAAASSGSVSVGAGLSARLAWAPPALTSPITVQVTNANRRLFLDNTRDYRLNIAEPLKRELWIEGGRNVVVVGGQITIDAARHAPRATRTTPRSRSASAIPSGTVHIWRGS